MKNNVGTHKGSAVVKIMPRVKRNHPWHYEKTSRPRREEINEMADRFSEEQTGACDGCLKGLASVSRTLTQPQDDGGQELNLEEGTIRYPLIVPLTAALGERCREI